MLARRRRSVVGRSADFVSSSRRILASFSAPMTPPARRSTVLDMNRVRDMWANDRGRLAHYLVASSLAIFLIAEFATLKDIIGDPVQNRWAVTALAAVSGIALLFIRSYPFAAPIVSATALLTTLFLMQPYIARETDAPFLVAILFIPWCLGTYNDTPKAIAG